MSSVYLYRMESKPEELLTVRMDTETYLEFQAACRLRGGSMSSIVHQYAVKVIWEEKEKHPQRFDVMLEKYREKLRLKREATEEKKASNARTRSGEETTRKATSGLVAVPPATNAALAVDLTRRTGVKIEPYQVALYRISLENKCDEFHELPNEIKEVISAYFEGTLKDYLSKREKTG
jgi:hypothetical protein